MNTLSIKILLTGMLLILGLGIASAQDANLVVISNSKGAPSEMKMAQLKSVLRGEKQRWPDGTKVVIALMKTNTSIGTATSKKILNMGSDELNKYWLALVFQGKADAPNFFNSESDLEAFVAQTQGSIGVVSQAASPGKAIAVDGKKVL